MSRTRLSVDRRHSLSGRDNLDWFFANRKWVRTGSNSIIECAWAKRLLPESEAGIRFLLLASKRSHKRAHDRNKIKRWLRAAISEIPAFAEIESELSSSREQFLVMMRISKPVRELEWPSILGEVKKIAEYLQKRL